MERFILDFCCLNPMLAVEVDGPIHDVQQTRDAERAARLQSLGFCVLRFTNGEVEQDIERAVATIRAALNDLASDPETLP